MNDVLAPPADPHAVLRQVFGFPAFRGLQEAAVRCVLEGGDALVLMPTGGGKSVCYQLPALCRPGLGVVVSPLIALMDDQVAAMRQLGIAAAALHSELEAPEARDTARSLVEGELKILYVSPERLLLPATLERLGRLKLALFAIDEAHCVSAWGHEFRPEYRALACLAERFPGVPRVALTATADARTRRDIMASLNMQQAAVFAASFHRTNLHIAATPKSAEQAQLLAFLQAHAGAAGIVYCNSRAKTERTAAWLAGKGFAAIAFHAGLPAGEKRASLARFRSGEAVVIVATIAFGMGIDRPDVRFVVHLDMPDSPEAYYQQIGRAGRDGERADTLLLYGGEDIMRARHWLAQSAAPDAQKRVMRERLEAMIALTETVGCRTRALLACFGEALAEPCGHCDNCVTPGVTFDGTVAAQKVLSAVYRTGQMFGAVHITAVLRGQDTEAVRKHRHDKLPVFGIGAEHGQDFWRGVIRQLLALGALSTDGEYGGLVLVTETARPILRGEVKLMLRQDPVPAPRTRARAAAPAPAAAPPAASGPDPFEALRAWRAAEAKRQAVPPYVIFHDSVLREIAASRPAGREELAQIKGVGGSKLERYGAAVLDVLRER
jgi:ATP-dependent DNA helicase RecQ